MSELLSLLPEILEKGAVVVGACATIATVTPTKKDDTIVGYLSALIHAFGMNFGNAKNLD